MAEPRADVLTGTLELLVLTILSREPMHGWGITQRIEQMSRQVLSINQGSLYPALERLKRKAWIRDEWRTTENNRRARFYELTAAGRKQLAVERGEWQRSSAAVNLILAWAEEGR
jgi:transcriptional regulator